MRAINLCANINAEEKVKVLLREKLFVFAENMHILQTYMVHLLAYKIIKFSSPELRLMQGGWRVSVKGKERQIERDLCEMKNEVSCSM